MKFLPEMLLLLAVQISLPAFASQSEETPAQQLIAAARQQLAADSAKVPAHAELAGGFIRRYRETTDTAYLKSAEQAIADGLKLDPTDVQLLRTRAMLLLNQQRFAEAKHLATELNRRIPDDVLIYGYLAEADIALGNEAKAEENAQWMMNLRPNNTPALLVGAKLRSLWGDSRGAIDFLNQAYSQTSPLEIEELAWIANQIASIQIERGENEAAEQTLLGAEKLFTPYPRTMETMSRIRIAQNRPAEAVKLLLQATALDHDPHQLHELAKAQQAAGRQIEAQATFARFEKLASDPVSATDESTIDLIFMKAADPETASESLRLAQRQLDKKQDPFTLDAYAWALSANSKYPEAEAAIKKALAVGTQDPQLFDHAGHIELKLNRNADANKYFDQAFRVNPSSEFAADARRASSSSTLANTQSPVTSNAQKAEAGSPSRSASESLSLSTSAVPDESAPSVSGLNAPASFDKVPESLLTPRATETEQQILKAQVAITRTPKDARLYQALGAAYFQHARESGDVSDYDLAEKALTKSIDLDSSDFSSAAAFQTMAEVCMGEHRFKDALTYAHKALSLGSGDRSPFAILGDAYADMGEYSRAEDAYNRLTPQDTNITPREAYARDSRLSYLKFVAGDSPAAIKLMQTAVLEGVEAQLPTENLAWLYYELGEFESQSGDSAAADQAYLAALNTHPGDYRALAALAKLRANHGRYDEAIELYTKAIAVVPMPIYIAELGDVFAKTGKHEEAEKQFALVQYIGLLGHINQVLHNRDLAIFYADHDMKLGESLDLAQKELEVRHDVYTLDALAWALFKNGKLDEAAKTSQQATRFGTKDSLLLFHAGMIAAAHGQVEQARSALREALQVNPNFHFNNVATAQRKLAALQTQLASKEGNTSDAR